MPVPNLPVKTDYVFSKEVSRGSILPVTIIDINTGLPITFTGGSTSDASAANQAAQIALEQAISDYLAVIAPKTTSSEVHLAAIKIAIDTINTNVATLNSVVATSAKQDSLLALQNPTAKYKITETDTTSTPYYYGYVDKDGNWYIMKQVLNTGTTLSFTYVAGTSGFSTAWTARGSQTYTSFDSAF